MKLTRRVVLNSLIAAPAVIVSQSAMLRSDGQSRPYPIAQISVRKRCNRHDRVGAAMDLVKGLVHIEHSQEAARPVKAAVFRVHLQSRDAEVALQVFDLTVLGASPLHDPVPGFANYAFLRVDVRPGLLVSEMDVVGVDEYGQEFDKVTYRRPVRT